jgi:hypothetical protein
MATLATAAMLVGLTEMARASDYCIGAIDGASTLVTLVGKGFRVPGKGRCKPFMGLVDGYGSDLTGSACTSTSGSHLALVLTQSGNGGAASVYHVDVDLVSGKGDVKHQDVYDGSIETLDFQYAKPCPTTYLVP